MDEIEEFENTMQEEPQRADETRITFDQPAEPEEPIQADTEKTVTMSVGQFGATVAGIYCTLSDFIYKKVKKTDTAPAWGDTDREALQGALVPVLEQYNITVSPLTNLIVTVAVIEAVRYNKPKERKEAEHGADVE